MKPSRSAAAFTLIEMLMVMVIISILAALIVAVAGYAQKKATRERARVEIQGLVTACERYKADNGTYPREENTTEQAGDAASPIDPRLHGDPQTARYKASSLYLYKQLSGDTDADLAPKVPTDTVSYYEFKPPMLGGISTSASTNTGKVTYLQDPWGFSYGYSTSGARAEEEYRNKATTGSTAPKRTDGHGYNVTVDMWSTAGLTITPPTAATQVRWVKNW